MSIENLSPHFTYREATYSATARDRKIDNNPNPAQLEAMKYTAMKMEAVRQLLDARPLYITSWFRSFALNVAINGAQGSQHSKGEAVDFKCPGWGSPEQICRHLLANKTILQYDQLILEPTWVHISFVPHGARGNELTWRAPGHYMPGITKV
jgi:Peptidase M15.